MRTFQVYDSGVFRGTHRGLNPIDAALAYARRFIASQVVINDLIPHELHLGLFDDDGVETELSIHIGGFWEDSKARKLVVTVEVIS